jgi:hypothetical protein
VINRSAHEHPVSFIWRLGSPPRRQIQRPGAPMGEIITFLSEL